jgi:hypothetical protein
VTSEDEPSAAAPAQHALAAAPGSSLGRPSSGRPSSGRPSSGRPSSGRPRAPIAHRTRLAASRRRPRWKWLLIGLLLAFSLATTGLYAVTLIRAISVHHWAAALDASRDAVPAAVGWAALLLVFFPRSTPEAEQVLFEDNHALSEKLRRAARDQASMDNAEHKVQRLTAKLGRLAAARDHASLAGRLGPDASGAAADSGVTYLDPGAVYLGAADAELDQEIGETTARLDQARQWLASAQDAVAVSQRAVADAEDRLMSDFPELARQPDRPARKPA